MTIYRRFVRAKKGMSTVFGGLFFVILILMGFNLMLWGFIQYDNYNTTLRSMNQNDQLAISENLVPTNPGAQNFTSTSFNIPVNNLGGTTVSIARIYITNISPTGGTHCTSSDPNSQGSCIVDTGSGTQNCAGNGLCYFTNGNVAAGVIYQLIHVNFKSFNFTQGSQTQSQSAFCVPTSTTMVYWVEVANTATNSGVTLEASTMMEMQPYSANGFGQFVRTWIVSPTSINPASITPYNQNPAPVGNPYYLPPAPANGAAAKTPVYFGGTSQSGTGGINLGNTQDNWLTFIGFYYIYQNQPQGETIPFMDFKSTAGYPGTC